MPTGMYNQPPFAKEIRHYRDRLLLVVRGVTAHISSDIRKRRKLFLVVVVVCGSGGEAAMSSRRGVSLRSQPSGHTGIYITRSRVWTRTTKLVAAIVTVISQLAQRPFVNRKNEGGDAVFPFTKFLVFLVSTDVPGWTHCFRWC